jgi:hypothetical protein
MPLVRTKIPREVDLHIHSVFSDGQCSIEQLVEKAFKKNLRAISITDHDNIGAYPQAQRIGRQLGIEVIPGVEFSSTVYDTDIHILAYGFDIFHPTLNSTLFEIRQSRLHRAHKIIERLNALGIDLRFTTVRSMCGQGSIGRPHIANAMIKEEFVYCFRDAFERYLGIDRPAYVAKKTLPPHQIMDLVHDAGGVTVLAHPGITRIDDKIPELVSFGLDGIETFHPEHSNKDARKYRDLAAAFGLFITGGSDFHLHGCGVTIGSPHIAYDTVLDLKSKRKDPVQ